MPLYDFQHEGHRKFEELVPWTTKTLPCRECGAEAQRLVSAPQRTATLWGDTQFGIHGHFDQGLQRRVSSYKETDRILEERGLVRASDLGGDLHWERQQDAALLERETHKKETARMQEAMTKFDGDKVKAMEEMYPAKQMLAEAAAYDKSHGITD